MAAALPVSVSHSRQDRPGATAVYFAIARFL